MAKESRQKLKYLENEKSFWGEISIYHHFKGLSLAKNRLRRENAPLKFPDIFRGYRNATLRRNELRK